VDSSTLLLTGGSNIKVWWRCEKKHEWMQTPCIRTTKGYGCPACDGGRMIILGVNDLKTLLPELSSQLIDADPEKLKMSSSRKVWWRCEKEHEWIATVANRALRKPT
jgi:hypothetical protein